MKKLKFLLIILLFPGLINSCKKDNIDPEPDNSISDIELSNTDAALIQSSNEFGLELFAKIAGNEEVSENLFVSPMSVAFALAMTYNGADGSTKEAMESALKLTGLTTLEINTSFKYLMNALVNLDPDVLLQIANSIWYRDTFTVLDEFITVNQEYYSAEVSALDFSDPGAVDIINNWVAENTNDKITEIITQISPLTVMFLINAIYFKGTWKYEFDEAYTQNMNFYLADGSINSVPTMSMKATTNYFSDDLIQAIELPYGSDKFSMMVILPQHNYTCNDVIDQLNDDNWNTWISGFYEDEVNVYLPKFKFEYEKKLNEVLCDMGMDVAFDPDNANFSKINSLQQIYISKVKHKTYVDVNEEGTEAAAVTVVEMELTSVGDEKYFTANKPFMFAIREKSTNSILFIGKVANPVYED
ncbi:serpin family protein [Bacteroidota bacterium]